jgi:methionine biosynthesis protein MetW
MTMKKVLYSYFASLYQRTMTRAYDEALDGIADSLSSGGQCLDCGAGNGSQFFALKEHLHISESQYVGVEWEATNLTAAKQKGLQVVQANLNRDLPFADRSFQCVFALSVLEHLVFGCKFLQEAHRVLAPGGSLIIVTPNLSAWFNILLLALGKMPSSGPHPDSTHLVQHITSVQFRETGAPKVMGDVPTDRHIVVFTFRVLDYYLKHLGFENVRALGFGLYPFPNFLQPFLERADPWHCHQMFFRCRR